MKNAGFTLLEVMIAFAIFSFFIAAFMVGHGNNVADSTLLDEEAILKIVETALKRTR